MKIAAIIPATKISLNRPQIFSYEVPLMLASKLQNGMIVEIPFGKRIIAGVVFSISDGAKANWPLKPIRRILWAEPVFTQELAKLAFYLSARYLVSLGLVVKAAITKPATRAKTMLRALQTKAQKKTFKLNQDQIAAVKAIVGQLGKSAAFLLHGVTGSGKTEVYLTVIEKLLKRGKQVLILVPEIALTPQTLNRFANRFPREQIAVVHSKISYGQKFLIWKKVLNHEIKILIGPRSAIFGPFKSLGLIVIDEEHDPSYKQAEQAPKFHAREAAKKLSEIWSCPLILGDATPSVETYFLARQSKIQKLTLPRRIHQDLPKVTLIDMREEARGGNFSIFSQALLEEITQTLMEGKQTILFMNRRGMATSMFCRDCGELVVCSRCSVPLVFHNRQQRLSCHHCQRWYDMPLWCASCGSHRLKLAGTGTEKIEAQIASLFPKARVGRFDRDTVNRKSGFENMVEDFLSKKFDILVGTQMLAKGWDLANIGLIGVINADTALVFPDFRSNERTFQLITQVAGRAGRRDFPGKVIFQTYAPENFAIQAAVTHNYQRFYEQEIQQREQFNYPPFCRLIKCTIKHGKQEKALASAENLVDMIAAAKIPDLEILGPSPAFIPRVRGKYIVYVIIKQKTDGQDIPLSSALQSIASKLSPAWDIDVNPDSLL